MEVLYNDVKFDSSIDNQDFQFHQYRNLLLQLLDLYLSRQLERFRFQIKQIGQHLEDGASLELAELEFLLTSNQDDDLTLEDQSIHEITTNIDQFEREVSRWESHINKLESPPFVTLKQISRRSELTWFEQRCLLLAVASEWNPKYEKIFSFLQKSSVKILPTAELALDLFSPTHERFEHEYLLQSNRKLFIHFLKSDNDLSHSASSTWLVRPLKLCNEMIDLLSNRHIYTELEPYVVEHFQPNMNLAPLLVQESVQQELRNVMRSLANRPGISVVPFILLLGKSGSGKTFQMKHLATHLKCSMISFNVSTMLELYSTMQSWTQVLMRMLVVGKIQQSLLVFTKFETLLETTHLAFLNEFVRIINLNKYPVFLNSTKSWKPASISQQGTIVQLELDQLSEAERWKLWEKGFELHQIDTRDVEMTIATKFHLTPGHIESAILQAKQFANSELAENGKITMDRLHRACYLQTEHQLTKKAKKLSPKYHWQDLILPKDQFEQLKSACNHVTFKHIVYGEWGYDKKLSYGKGISMLFVGPPGTGKTMSAEIIANVLKLEIYKIDLSQVVSKYIGETEKNLNEVFQEAQSSNAILFFDEMDALFGKRSEVKDAHDKYANLETAYLLQKMEEYKGICVLASNHLMNIDEAFLRRINYIIRFPFPDAEQRELIWRTSFPKECPLADDIDFAFISKRFEIAGGSIKNVVMTAAFLAVEHDHVIRMKHVVQALKYEQQKNGKTLLKEDLGPYSNLLN